MTTRRSNPGFYKTTAALARSGVRWAAPAAAGLLLTAGSVIAQTADKKDTLTPPTASISKASEGSLVTLALIVVLGVLVVVVSLFPVKREVND